MPSPQPPTVFSSWHSELSPSFPNIPYAFPHACLCSGCFVQWKPLTTLILTRFSEEPIPNCGAHSNVLNRMCTRPLSPQRASFALCAFIHSPLPCSHFSSWLMPTTSVLTPFKGKSLSLCHQLHSVLYSEFNKYLWHLIKFIQDCEPGCTCKVWDKVLNKVGLDGLKVCIYMVLKLYLKTFNIYKSLKQMSHRSQMTICKWSHSWNYFYRTMFFNLKDWWGRGLVITELLKFRSLSEWDNKPWQFTVGFTLTIFS